MRKFRIKYQIGNNIMFTEVQASCLAEALYRFYMSTVQQDVLDVKEVTDETKS